MKLNGFSVPHFEKTVGVSLPEIRGLMTSLKGGVEFNSLSPAQREALRTATILTMSQLNVEFQTRTGFILADAEQLVQRLN
jgi:hypothetical protein